MRIHYFPNLYISFYTFSLDEYFLNINSPSFDLHTYINSPFVSFSFSTTTPRIILNKQSKTDLFQNTSDPFSINISAKQLNSCNSISSRPYTDFAFEILFSM